MGGERGIARELERCNFKGFGQECITEQVLVEQSPEESI